MSAISEPHSKEWANSDSGSVRPASPHFAQPCPTGVIPYLLQADRYRATEPQSHKATEHNPSGEGGVELRDFFPESQEKHSTVWEGSDNCLWRLCRRILSIKEESKEISGDQPNSIFENWYDLYREWCTQTGENPEPKSRLHEEFLVALEKCKLPDGEKLVSYAFKRAKELPLPPEASPFHDDENKCLLISTLRECAKFNDKGGFFYASTRDIEKYTELCNKDTASRWLKQLALRDIIFKVLDGKVSATNGIATRFIYVPLADVEKMAPDVRKLYEACFPNGPVTPKLF